MPVNPNRQSPTQSSTKTTPSQIQTFKPVNTGSILGEAVAAEDINTDFIKILIFGPNRVGKTHLAGTFPKPALFCSFEPSDSGGARTIKRVQGVKVLTLDKIQSTERAARLCLELRNGGVCDLPDKRWHGKPYQTVVVDSVTSYQDLVLQEILKVDRLPEQLGFGTVSGDQYRDRAERTKQGLRYFKDLRCNVVFLGKEKDHNPPKDEKVGKTGKVQPDMRPRFLRGMQMESVVATDLGGGTAGWIHDVCDYTCRLYFDKEMLSKTINMSDGSEVTTANETGKFIRVLRMGYHPNFWCGARAEVPENFPEYIENPTYSKILAAIQGTYKPEE